jgi:hypothetical protein
LKAFIVVTSPFRPALIPRGARSSARGRSLSPEELNSTNSW